MLGPFKRRPLPKTPSGRSEGSIGKLRQDVASVSERLDGLERTLKELQAVLTSQHDDLLRQLRPEGVAPSEAVPTLTSILRQIGHGRPVVAGPWRGEVGWELLYWIPFVRWLSEHGLAPDRTVAVSRGGPRSWYRGLADRYVDVAELPEQWRGRSIADVSQKQRMIDPHDTAAARHVADECGFERFVHLHPSTMYRMLQPYWTGNAPASYLHRLTVVDRLTPPPVPAAVPLPDRFVVVKIYDSRAFRLTDATAAWARETIAALASATDVVVLNPVRPDDDHPPLAVESAARVHTIDPTQWGDNLDVQTAIVARSAGLLATYGGFSYLGPLVGVPTVAVYANPEAVLGHHLELASEMFDRLAPGSYAALHVDHFQMLRLSFTVEPS